MRELLFRGKRTDGGGLVEGDFSKPNNIITIEREFDPVIQREDTVCNDYNCIPETIGQFTGLCDINGKRIFEKNIVTDIRGFRYEVVYVPERAAFYGFGLETDRRTYLNLICRYCKVTGNVFDDK